MTESQELLSQYVQTGSELAFRQLAERYTNLVYSASIRLLNGDSHAAQDVTQVVFTDLARTATTLPRDVLLGGWLHRHTCFVAHNYLRAERRRATRERIATEMNDHEAHSEAALSQIAPILDEAVNQLPSEDRNAILLRFFEQRPYNAVGELLGTTEEAARKRVDRALHKLQRWLRGQGVVLTVTSLTGYLLNQTVVAAPLGLALTISSAAVAGVGATAATANAVATFHLITMTKLQAGLCAVLVAVGISVPLWLRHQSEAKLSAANQSIAQLRDQVESLDAENRRLTQNVAAKSSEPVATVAPTMELLKLRGEVAKLRQEVAQWRSKSPAPSAMSSIRQDPAMWKAVRDQQKMAMGMIYKEFAQLMKFDGGKSEKFGDLLADDVMENVDIITEVLRLGMTSEQMEPVFAAQEAALQEKVRELLGPEALAQYQEFSRNLGSHLTAIQFEPLLSGEKSEREKKGKQLYNLLREETQTTLQSHGLPADFQIVPTLNFRNIASESEGEKNLKMLGGILERAAQRAGGFLSPDEIKKFDEFRNQALAANRMGLTMNRKLMAPAGR